MEFRGVVYLLVNCVCLEGTIISLTRCIAMLATLHSFSLFRTNEEGFNNAAFLCRIVLCTLLAHGIALFLRPLVDAGDRLIECIPCLISRGREELYRGGSRGRREVSRRRNNKDIKYDKN